MAWDGGGVTKDVAPGGRMRGRDGRTRMCEGRRAQGGTESREGIAAARGKPGGGWKEA